MEVLICRYLILERKKKSKNHAAVALRQSLKRLLKRLFGDAVTGIKVLGAGCKSCHEQYEYVKEAVKNMGLDIEVEYITDMAKVMEYGVMSMPAIVVNEKVLTQGKVLKADYIEKLLQSIV